MDPPDALASLLPGKLARRRARVLWRRLVEEPPANVVALAGELGVSTGTVRVDQLTGLLDLRRLRRQGATLDAIPPGTRLHEAVFGDQR